MLSEPETPGNVFSGRGSARILFAAVAVCAAGAASLLADIWTSIRTLPGLADSASPGYGAPCLEALSIVFLTGMLINRHHLQKRTEAGTRRLAIKLVRSEEFARSTTNALSARVAALAESRRIIAHSKAGNDFTPADQCVLEHAINGAKNLASISTPDAGAGSTFVAKIPSDSGLSDVICQIERSPADPIRLRGRILLAEDGLDNQVFLTAILQSAGLSVTVAEDGASAVEQIGLAAFDMVLMDMQMPTLDGYGATRALRQLGFCMPIIALTAHTLATDRDKCLDCGCTEYLAKPIDGRTLLETVARFLKLEMSNTAGVVQTAAGTQKGKGPIRSSLSRDPVMGEIVPSFVGALPARVALITSLLARADFGKLRVIVHQLKGSGGSYGFDCITGAAAVAEAVIDAGCPIEEVKKSVEALVEMIRRVKGYNPAREASGSV